MLAQAVDSFATVKFLGQAVGMLALLCFSAFFSGTETAYFNLSRRQRQVFRHSKNAIERLAASIAERPRPLLGCLLLGNMTVNVLYFAAAGVLSVTVERRWGLPAAAAAGFSCFMILVLFGEILPKSLAYDKSRAVSVAAALPLLVCLRVLGPLQAVFRVVLAEPMVRLLLGPAKGPRPIGADEFKSLVEQIRKHRLITDDETRLLTEIMELALLKVRHVMRPRVDMVACAVTDSPARACELMLRNNLTKLPVYVGKLDHIVGLVHLRLILLRPGVSLDRLVQQVRFVPEQKSLESLLDFFRTAGTDTAVVVDEYGGIAGSIRVEDVAEELFGPVEPAAGEPMVQRLGPLKYRLAGNLPMHEWADTFGMDMAASRFSTMGGMVTALLGRVPRAGDTAAIGNIKLTVEQVSRNRVRSIVMTLEPIRTNG
jgi:CBS domain containing-hemolysin-like protein